MSLFSASVTQTLSKIKLTKHILVKPEGREHSQHVIQHKAIVGQW